MKRGKQTCRILKDIRRQIAEANDIEFITSECQYQGDCLGTCPKCEAEVRYLEQQIERKRTAGKAITLLGISAGLVAMSPMTSCSNSGNKGTSQEVTSDTTSYKPLIMGEEEPICDGDTIMAPVKEEIEMLGDIAPGDIDSVEVNNIQGYIPPVIDDGPKADSKDSIEFYEMVPVMPDFPGGQKALMHFIDKNIKYPDNILGEISYGRVIVQFIVDKEGNVVYPKIVRGIDHYLDKEALRIVGIMPKWKPGELKDGTKVNVRYTIPVRFRQQ